MPSLDVAYLARFLSRKLQHSDSTPAERQADQIIIHGLNLGLQDTYRFILDTRPSLDEFERWIIARNGGVLDPARIDWVNDTVRRAFAGEQHSGLSDHFQPVLSADDLQHWHDNGYLVLKNVISPEACAAAADAIWAYLGMDPAVPDTWYKADGSEGIFITMARHPAFDANRASPRIRSAFAQLFGTDDLLVTVDRGGFNPPERPGARFRGAGLHWDISIAPPIPLHIQGVLYLTDTPEEQGAFQCVPGFHRNIDQWLASLAPDVDPRGLILSETPVRVPAHAGDMVIWHGALPHGASPNRGARPRLVQYIYYYPAAAVDERPWV